MHMKSIRLLRLTAAGLLSSVVVVAGAGAQPVCPARELAGGLILPQSITRSPLGNLLVSESGTRASHTGRISIVGPGGSRRTLLDGLPSGISDVGDPAGPSGLFLRGRTLYALIGIGDAILPGTVMRTALPNPNPSSPIFSSLLAIHFNANVEKTTHGFTLSMADQGTLAAGRRVILSNGGGDTLEIELVADFPDYVHEPLPFEPANVRGSNPFGVAVVADRAYVTDGGRNLVWSVDIPTGAFEPLSGFPPVPNPLFPTVGPPTAEAVPTGIVADGDGLLVALLRGVPFANGTSTVERIDRATGGHVALIGGLKTAIDVEPLADGGYLVLQHSSGQAPFFAGPGLLLSFPTASGPASTLASCLSRPTSMVFDPQSRAVYVTELITGRIVVIEIP